MGVKYKQPEPLAWWAWDEKWVTLTCPECSALFDALRIGGVRQRLCEDCRPARKPRRKGARHGVEYAYRQLKCRCDECVEYKRAYNKRHWRPRVRTA